MFDFVRLNGIVVCEYAIYDLLWAVVKGTTSHGMAH